MIGLVVAVTMPAIPQSASAGVHGSPPAIDPWTKYISAPVLAKMRAQEQLEPAAKLLYDAAREDGGTGFASVAFEGNGLTLYYKGSLTARMTQAIHSAARFGTMRIHRVPYSRIDLEKVAAKLEQLLRGSDYQSIELNYQVGSITVETMPAATRARVRVRQSQLHPNSAPLMAATASVLAGVNVGVPLSIRAATSSVLSMDKVVNAGPIGEDLVQPNIIPFGRNNDIAAYNAGGVIRNYDAPNLGPGGYVQCTSGFAVHFGATSRVLTAGHCGSFPDVFYDGGSHTSTDRMGTVSGTEDWDKDIMIIDALGAPLMFTGAVGSNTYSGVNSWGYWVAGEYLCQSGASGGEECALLTGHAGTYSYQITDSDGDTFNVHGMIKATKQDTGHSCVGGDSGGPVFALNGSGVKAKGVISGCDDSTTQSEMLFQDMADVNSDYGTALT